MTSLRRAQIGADFNGDYYTPGLPVLQRGLHLFLPPGE